MTVGQPPFRAGQKVHVNSATHPADGYVLSVHRSTEIGGWEIIVRTQDLVDRPGRNVNVHITGNQSSLLTAINASERVAS